MDASKTFMFLRTLRQAAYSLITLDMIRTADRATVTNSADKKAKPGSKPGFALLIVNYLNRLNVLGLEALAPRTTLNCTR